MRISLVSANGYARFCQNVAGLLSGSVVVCAFLISTGDIAAMKLCQFHTDRDEEARSDFTCVVSLDFRSVLYTEGSETQIVKLVSIQQTVCVRAGNCLQPCDFFVFCTDRVGAGDCLQPCSVSPYCKHQVGVGGCLHQDGFSPYCTHCLGAGR